MIEFSGVRSSWLTFARNSFFILFASYSVTLLSASSTSFKSSDLFTRKSWSCLFFRFSSIVLKTSESCSNSSPVLMSLRSERSPLATRSA